MRYPNTLRQHRVDRAMTQWDVARAVDIALDRYARLEQGRTEPSYGEAVLLGAFFRVNPTRLFPVRTAA